MDSALNDKLDELRRAIASFSSAIVAFSGGVDSALVLAVAREQLGDRAIGCIGLSPSYPKREYEAAIEFANRLNVPVRTVATQEHLNPSYVANGSDRCFHCKSDLYTRLAEIRDGEAWSVILDGTHAGDLAGHRHGLIAAREHGVRSPLAECGIDKPQVRAISRLLGLAVWDKPAMACLSSRVPTGTAVTPKVLRQIERAEDVLVELGFGQFRVRHHGELARIELRQSDIFRAVEMRDEIVNRLRGAGYKHVTIDLAGFRREDAVVDTVPLTIRGQA
jgi:pyridinium-3,5-biscarboxylic acid mononucleotide sulfurtransferase